MNQSVIIWICIIAVFGIGGYKFYQDNKNMKQNKKIKSKIIHFEHNGRYACNEAVNTTKEKLSKDWDNVTCKNCHNVKFYK